MLPIVPELAAKIELIIYNSNITKNIFSFSRPIFGVEKAFSGLSGGVNGWSGRSQVSEKELPQKKKVVHSKSETCGAPHLLAAEKISLTVGIRYRLLGFVILRILSSTCLQLRIG